MLALKERMAQQIPALREELKALSKDHGNKVISEVTVGQAFGGMRGVKGLVCDTSVVDADTGLVIRGIPIDTATRSGVGRNDNGGRASRCRACWRNAC